MPVLVDMSYFISSQVLTTDVEALDEESVVDNTCKLLYYEDSEMPYERKVSRLNPLEDWLHCDRFLAFCKKV
ncbi:hypothetical protein Hanom_Chr16g01439211 [Helianthus anomalus]